MSQSGFGLAPDNEVVKFFEAADYKPRYRDRIKINALLPGPPGLFLFPAANERRKL